MRVRLTVILTTLGLLTAACGPADPTPEPDPPSDDPAQGAPAPDDVDPGDDSVLEGVFGGDPQLEGGCAWVDAEEERYEVLWPDGYEVAFEPLRLTGPDGEVVAEEGDTVRISGREAPDVATICQVGRPYQAAEVEAAGQPTG